MKGISLDTIRLKLVWVFLPILLVFAKPSSSSLLYGVMLSLIGLGIRIWAAGFINKLNDLATNGPYAHTRNPLYVGTLTIGMGFSLASNEPLLILVCLTFFCLVYVPKILQEAKELESRFGDQYRSYAKCVPLVFPRYKAYRNESLPGGGSNGGFSFYRYLANREWEALLATGLVFGLLFVKFLR